jgi:hypothetical protein
MTKKLVLAGLTAAAIAVPATGAAATTTHHKCGKIGTAAGKIRATHVSCATARKVVRADIQGKKYRSFTCKSRPYPGGAAVTCHNGQKKVTFQVAD